MTDPLKNIRELLASQSLGVLSTHRGGAPYASLVAVVASLDLRELYFVTTRGTRKFANLSADRRAAMLIDSRTNRTADFTEAIAVTALGTTEELRGEERGRALAIYLARHPHLGEFAASPSSALVRLQVTSYYLVQRFQDVTEYHFPP